MKKLNLLIPLLTCLGLNVLFAQNEVEPNGSFAEATPITLSNGEASIQGAVSVDGDNDTYVIEVNSPGVFSARLTNVPSALSPHLEIFDPEQASLEWRYDGGGQPVFVNKLVCSPGVYYVRVRGVNNRSSSPDEYTLTVQFDTSDAFECNEGARSARQVSFGEVINASIYDEGDVDFFKVTVPQAGVLSARAFNVPLDIAIRLELQDPAEGRLEWKYEGGGQGVFVNKLVCDPGTYYVRVSDVNNDDSSPEQYSLIIELDTSDPYECNNGFGSAPQVGFGELIKASIYDTGDEDVFKVVVPQTGVLSARTFNVPTEIATLLELYNSNEENMLWRYNGGGQAVSIDAMICVPGTYYIKVSDVNDDDSSPEQYSLMIELDTSDPFECNNRFETAGALALCRAVEAAIYNEGDEDFYRFQAAAGETISFSLTSVPAGLNPIVEIYDANQTRLDRKTGSAGAAINFDYTFPSSGAHYLRIYDSGDNFSSPETYTLTAETTNCAVECPAINLSPNTMPADCGQTNGSVAITVVGGTAPYTFQLGNDSNTTGQFDNLAAGAYNVSLMDNQQCAATISFSITETSAPSAGDVSVAQPTCEAEGQITVAAAGSGGALEYSIDGGGTFQGGNVFSNLSPGAYNIIVREGACQGEYANNPVILNQPVGCGNINSDKCRETYAGFTLVANDANAEPGEQICIDVCTANFTNIAAISFTMNYDDILLQFDTIDNIVFPNVNEFTYGETFGTPTGPEPIRSGNVTMVWTSPGLQPFAYDDGTVILQLCFTVKADAPATATKLEFTGDLTPIAVTDADERDVNFNGVDGLITISGGGNTDGVTLIVGEAEGLPGEIVDLPVSVRGLSNLASLQGSIDILDDAIGEVTEVIDGAISPLYNLTTNVFSFRDGSGLGVPLNDDDVLFTLRVRLTGPRDSRSDVVLTDTPLFLELTGVVDGATQLFDPQTEIGMIAILGVVEAGGQVYFWKDRQGVNNALITAEIVNEEGTSQKTATTSADGMYRFQEVPVRSQVSLNATKTGGFTDGLSSYPLFLMQQYILLMDPPEISQPYQVIAADANCDGRISAFDLALFQQIIVGFQNELSGCPSWVFIPADHTFSGMTQADIFPFPVLAAMTNIEENVSADFVGVKMGDMLGRADPGAAISFRSDQEAVIRAVPAADGQIDFKLSGWEELVSLQLAVDLGGAHLNDFKAGALENALGHVDEAGALRISWFSQNGRALPLNPDDVLFTLDLEDGDAERLQFDRRILHAEAYNRNLQKRPLILQEAVHTDVGDLPSKPDALHVFPNPARESFTLSYALPAGRQAVLRVSDALGRTVFSKELNVAEGLRVDCADWANGLYWVQVQDEGHSLVEKVIIDR